MPGIVQEPPTWSTGNRCRKSFPASSSAAFSCFIAKQFTRGPRFHPKRTARPLCEAPAWRDADLDGRGAPQLLTESRLSMTRKDSRPRPAATVPAGEAELVARAQRGDEAAFAALYRAYKRRIYVLCLRMTNSVPEAEDLTQQVFLTVFRALAGFRGESSLSTWLYRVTVNEE